ncbi:MAG: hypothetical protein Fur0018_00430 [Anaerolineales bacterium]
MFFEVIENEERMAELSEAWNALLTQAAIRVPFLRHEYLSAWWAQRGGGEWPPDSQLFIVLWRDDDGTLKGIAPLFRVQTRLLLLGSFEISDYLDFIAPADSLARFLHDLLDFLAARADWQVLDCYNLLEDSPSRALLAAEAAQRGWPFDEERLQPAPRLLLAPSWEDYLAGLSKKQRHEVRRKLRRAESLEQEMRWHIVSDEASLDAEIDAFLTLMAYAPDKEVFLSEVMRSQMRHTIHTAFRAGWLQLAFLEINGQKAAAYLNLDFDNQIWVYNSGLNFEHSALSPGWVLLSYLIQWAIEHGRSCLDFMRGDEEYKYRFGGQDRFIWRARLSRTTEAAAT